MTRAFGGGIGKWNAERQMRGFWPTHALVDRSGARTGTTLMLADGVYYHRGVWFEGGAGLSPEKLESIGFSTAPLDDVPPCMQGAR